MDQGNQQQDPESPRFGPFGGGGNPVSGENIFWFQTGKPKNLRRGVKNGVCNVVGGALGGVGLIVLGPTVGLTAGVRQGGVVGGLLGLTGGTLLGVVGGVSSVVVGTVSGVSQVAKGVAAMPQAIQAQSSSDKTLWWNESTRTWTNTNLETIRNELPDDDSDILNDPNVASPSGDYGGKNRRVKDDHFYKVLGVQPNASSSTIKKNYYKLAREFHPDRATSDDSHRDAESNKRKFQEIAQAYQVLSDDQLRKEYDTNGISTDLNAADSVSPATLDPSLLAAYLFGSDKFNSFFGRLATSTSAMLGDTTFMTKEQARTLQYRRCARLALELVRKVQPYYTLAENQEPWRRKFTKQSQDLLKTSFGYELVRLIGMSYHLLALQFLGSVESKIGPPSLSRWTQRVSAKWQARQQHYSQKQDQFFATCQAIQHAINSSKKQEENKNNDNDTQDVLLRLLWTTTVIDITNTLSETCQMVFFDNSVAPSIRKQRAIVIQELGTIFIKAAKEHEQQSKKPAHHLLEEASMAAMMETIRRNEAAEGY